MTKTTPAMTEEETEIEHEIRHEVIEYEIQHEAEVIQINSAESIESLPDPAQLCLPINDGEMIKGSSIHVEQQQQDESTTQEGKIHITTHDWDVNETSKLLGFETRMMAQNRDPLRWNQVDSHDILHGLHANSQELCQCDSISKVRNVEIICDNKDDNDYDVPISSRFCNSNGAQNISMFEKMSNHVIHDIVIESKSIAQQQMKDESSTQVRPPKRTGYDTVDRAVGKMMRSQRKITTEDRHFSKFDQMSEHEQAVEDLVDGKQRQLQESTSFEFQNFSSSGQFRKHEADTHLQHSQITSHGEVNNGTNVEMDTLKRGVSCDRETQTSFNDSQSDIRQQSEETNDSQTHSYKATGNDQGYYGRMDLMAVQTTIINDDKSPKNSKEKVIEPIEVSEKRQVWTCCTFTGNKYCCILSVLLIILCIIGIVILIFLFAGSKKEESENELPEPEARVDCLWSQWSDWSRCSSTCGNGSKARNRSILTKASNGGNICSGERTTTTSCIEAECPVDGGWGIYNSITQCSKTCGKGVERKIKYCNNPEPKNGGANCKCDFTDGCDGKKSIVDVVCNLGPCPNIPCQNNSCRTVNGNWSPWQYGHCTKTCGRGVVRRKRSCNNPPPSINGRDCKGPAYGTIPCYSKACPVNGNWSPWQLYGQCTKTCGTGTIRRKRSCNNPAPSSGGKNCKGYAYDSWPCNRKACPVNCEWSTWGLVQACSKTCGRGYRSYARTKIVEEKNNGSCDNVYEKHVSCNNGPCSGACYQSVIISARDPVKTKQSTKMGQFYFYKMGSNGRPIYKNQRKQFLYSNSDSLWSIGNDYKGVGDLQHFTCKSKCPGSCSNQWYYWDGETYREDSSVNVSCGTN